MIFTSFNIQLVEVRLLLPGVCVGLMLMSLFPIRRSAS
jgi:hypothetical protein